MVVGSEFEREKSHWNEVRTKDLYWITKIDKGSILKAIFLEEIKQRAKWKTVNRLIRNFSKYCKIDKIRAE